MYKKLVLLLMISLGFVFSAAAQEKDTVRAEVEAPVELPVISYTTSPKKYKIADIKVTGMQNYEDYLLITLSGLSVGDEIYIPGDEISQATKRFWRNGLFSDVKILTQKGENHNKCL